MVPGLQARRSPQAVALDELPPPKVGGRERKPTKLSKREAAWPGRRRNWGGPGRRCGTSSKGRDLNCLQGLPGGTRPPTAVALGCRGLLATLGPKAPVPGRRGGRRQGCGLPVPAFDASLQAAQASPEGWEKLPERLGRTSDSWGQPSPRGAERCSQGLWSRLPGHCGGTHGEGGGGARTPLRGSKLAQVSAQAGRPAPKAQERVAVELAALPRPAPRRAPPATLRSQHCRVPEAAARHLSVPAPMGARHPLPRAPSPRSHSLDPAPRRAPKLREAPGYLGERRKRPQSQGSRAGEERSL